MRVTCILLSLGFLLTTACGGSKTMPSTSKQKSLDDNPDVQGLIHSPFTSYYSPKFTKDLEQFTVNCEECHPAVATFVSIKDQKMSFCGATLIEGDKVITARHCLPKDLQEVGANCSRESYVLFPRVGKEAAITARCLEVEALSPDYPNLSKKEARPDWAILTLDRKLPDDRVADISTEGLKDGEKVKFFKIMYQDPRDEKVVEFKRYNCKNFHNTPLEPSADAKITALMQISCDRKFSKGFSGFPFFTIDGKFVGHQGQMIHARKKRPNSIHAIGNNIACILDPANDEIKEACKWDPSKKRKKRQRIIIKKVQDEAEALDSAFQKWLTDNPQPVEWEKVDPEKMDSLPKAYRREFRQRKKEIRKKLGIKGDEAHKITALMLPYYPKCFNEVKNQGGFNYPIIHVALVVSADSRSYKIRFLMESIPGTMAMVKKKWKFGPVEGEAPTQTAALAANGEKVAFKGFIAKEVDIERCQ